MDQPAEQTEGVKKKDKPTSRTNGRSNKQTDGPTSRTDRDTNSTKKTDYKFHPMARPDFSSRKNEYPTI